MVNLLGKHQIIIELDGRTNKLDKDLAAVQKQLAETDMVAEMLNSSVAATKYYAIAAGAGLAALVLPTVFATQAVADFDDNLHRIVALGGGEFRSNLNQMTDTITQMSVRYGETTADISAAAVEFTKTGYEYSEVMALLDPTMQLAIANQEDAAATAQLMNNAYVLFGREGGMSIVQMADMIQASANSSKMDILDLFEAFQYSGSAASVANVSFSEYVSMVGALSQIAANAGESIGTLMTRMYTNSEKMENIIGNSDIVDEAKDNAIDITQLFRSLAKSSAETRAELFELWGVRNAKNFAQLYNATAEYEEILAAVQNSSGVLATSTEEMSGSITRLWERLKASIMAPLNNQSVMQSLTEAITSLQMAMGGSNIGDMLADLVTNSAEFLVQYAPQLFATLNNFATMIMDMAPTLLNLANSATNAIGAVAGLDPALITVIGSMVIGMKIMPSFVAVITQAGFALKRGGLASTSFYGGMLGLFALFGMILQEKDPVMKAIYGIVAALLALYMALSLITAVVPVGGQAFGIMKAGSAIKQAWSANKLLTVGTLGTGVAGAGAAMLLAGGTNAPGGDLEAATESYNNKYNTVNYNVVNNVNNYQVKEDGSFTIEIGGASAGGE